MNGDFNLMSGCFLLPHGFATFDGQHVVETEDALREVFVEVRAEFARKGVTQIIRTVEAVKRTDETTIQATHISHYMAGQTRINEPFPVFAITKWTGTEWRVASNQYAVEPGTNHSRILSGASPKSLQTGDTQ